MTERQRAFRAMRSGSIPGVIGTGTQVYGIDIDTMDHEETKIALGWALSQAARLMDRNHIGVRSETKQYPTEQ